MTDPVFSAVKSLAFCDRNTTKVENGQFARLPVAIGQAKNTIDAIRRIDKSIEESTNAALKAIKSIPKNEKLFDYTAKALNFTSKNINPLICVSAGVDVVMAEDKESAFITNSTALGCMFASEGLMKKGMEELTKNEKIKKMLNKRPNYLSNNKYIQKLPSMLKALAFVAGSCLSYNIGEKFGKLLLEQAKLETPKKK